MSKTQAEPKGAEGRSNGAAGGPSGELEVALEATVAAYLRGHPDFFERNPEVLADLHLHHEMAGAVSLIEHQVNLLRRQLEGERGRLSHLIARAREYESLSTRLHTLVLALLPVHDLERLQLVLHETLTREFSAEAVTLKLFPVDPLEAGADPDPLTSAFQDFLDRPHALCGPLDEVKNQVLFGDTGAEVHSAALIPIRVTGRSGVLAIGAADPERFKADMRTDVLDRLGEILSHKLRGLPLVPPKVPSTGG
jgi:hypothetical protein